MSMRRFSSCSVFWIVGSISFIRIWAASSLRKLVDNPRACAKGLSRSLSSLLRASRISRSAGMLMSRAILSRASSYALPSWRARSSSACIALMSECKPMLRITADCSSASAFISAASVSFAPAALTTSASSSRLFVPSTVPPTETTSMMARIAPKPRASRVPILSLRRIIRILGLVDAAADDQVLVAAHVHRLGLDRARHGIHELVVLPGLGVRLGHHLDAFLHEVLAVAVAQVDHIPADHLLVGPVGENLALDVLDDHVESPVAEGTALVVEVGERLLAADLLDVGDGLFDHRGGFGGGALGLRLVLVLGQRRGASEHQQARGEYGGQKAFHVRPPS